MAMKLLSAGLGIVGETNFTMLACVTFEVGSRCVCVCGRGGGGKLLSKLEGKVCERYFGN